MNKESFVIVNVLLVFMMSSYSLAYDNKITHRDITKKAVSNSILFQSAYLQEKLNIIHGIEENVNGKRIIDWLMDGAEFEDEPMCRASNHFHNPLLPWNQAQMSDDISGDAAKIRSYCAGDGWPYSDRKSNVAWATGFLAPAPDGQRASFRYPSGDYYSPMTWDYARDYFYKALTAKYYLIDNNALLAQTFVALGHVLHLLQDMAVPAHTRNDFQSHLIYKTPEELAAFNIIARNNPLNKRKQPFEYYVEENPSVVTGPNGSPNYPADFPAIENLKLTDFWDTDHYNGSNPSPYNYVGLAEFTNANYLSEYTIPNNNPTPEHLFPYPWVNVIGTWTSDGSYQLSSPNYQLCFDYEAKSTKKRKYISRNGYACPQLPQEAGKADHFAAVSILNRLYPTDVKVELDDNVHNTYAKELIPRAVGYSASLLNYFFRGTIDITPPAQYVYSIIDGSKPQQFTKIKANIKNTTLNNEAIVAGTITAVAKYKKRTDYKHDLSADPVTNLSSVGSEFSYSVSSTTELISEQADSMNMTPTEFTFDFTQDPIPAGVTDLSLQVIFKGTLGNEKDNAIAVGYKDLMEPTHHVFWNLTDRFSIVAPGDTTWHMKTAADIRADQNLLDFVNKQPAAYIDPYNITYEISYMGTSSATAVPSAHVTNLQPGQYIRLITLVDKLDGNYLKLTWTQDIEPGTSSSTDTFRGALNQDVNGTFTYIPIDTFRTIKQHYNTGILRCRPFKVGSITGATSCPYNDAEVPTPPNLAATPALITFE